ncbi:branched-chain amino acid ABC transporter permease [Azotobacter vinelandii]|uniref:branched-chain amino acid ABC transporter permease n=1 Tax=Azotobacter vinelandii TaxID=354 RepID=UPI00091F84E0|nr:branched-chain amino acid ABC transporter permease [Azotobacter vinelandii]WKN23127.1 branched-chain amino acid ABC transporter permease [Azotobacter vinelandii]SFY19639.1 amino acid/amide ABC transporter membrane protein 1, HAAT family (TC 3.A.1.4.-) [Azotobacter vinelandii]
MLELILQALYSGVLQGGSYALIALGLALVFGTMKMINLAHGELVLLAAYIGYMVESKLDLSPVFAIPIALVLVCTCSVLVYFLISLIRKDRELNSLILTYGVGIILTNAVLLIWSADVRSTSSVWLQDALVVGPFYSMRSEVLFFVVAAVLIGGLWWWLSRSWYGRAVRAVSSNRNAAKLMGINPHTTEIVSFVVAGILAAFAGVAIFSYGVIQPAFGHALTIKAFIITVLAGIGSIPGVLIGGLLLGVAESLTVTLASSALQELVGMALFLLVLFVMPNGLFGAQARRG